MSVGFSLIRFRRDEHGEHSWALVNAVAGVVSARPLEGRWTTTAQLLEDAVPKLRAGGLNLGAPLALESLSLLSPVTHPCRVIAQATNYREHAKEVGLNPKQRKANILFRKSSAAITGPNDAVVRPAHVRLLDYEIELGLVIGARTRGPTQITNDNLSDYVAALVVTNDISARDVQVPEGQFYKGKSYRTFLPCGPILFVPDRHELARWPELQLTLHVNGTIRQSSTCAHMIHKPADTLTEISSIEDLDPGDLILTGTPGGVAMRPPQGMLRSIANALPDAMRARLFVQSQLRRSQYLQPGDRIDASIRLDDGSIDLGTQHLGIAT